MIESEKLSIDVRYSNSDLLAIISECMQCGICTSVCPKRHVSKYNPRMIIHSALLGHALSMDDLTDCLTCGHCFEHCPQLIDFPNFIREYPFSTAVMEIITFIFCDELEIFVFLQPFMMLKNPHLIHGRFY